ncbi:MAG: zinc ribbon domain-containing protein [Anaerolineae bacterium]|nr:zinc ribbon domain-containing protein [Thermoflexales bacterium]MDW8395872.1 zinc ribbon domain-containing protein [Anaerolineae bacterium]
MTENISDLIIAAISLIGAITAALLGGLTIWTFRDIRARSRDPLVQILATVMVGVIPIAGVLVYLMLRPRETLSEQYIRALEEEALLASIENQEFCPTCGRRVDADMQFCPSCHTKLRNACPNCRRAVHLAWDLCPYCGSGLTPELPAVTVSKPTPKAVPATRPASPLPKPQPAQPEQVGARTIPTSQPDPMLQPTLAEAHPAQSGDVLDRIGGVIGNLIDRLTTRAPSAPKSPSPPPEPAAHPPTMPQSNGAPRVRKPLISRDELE